MPIATTIEAPESLATVLEGTLGKIALVERIFADHPPAEVGRDELDELGGVARIDEIPSAEREALIAVVMPESHFQESATESVPMRLS